MPQPDLPLIVEPDELERHLERDEVLVVDVGDQPTYTIFHVPGAVHLEYRGILAVEPPALGLLPDDRQLSDVLGSIGVTPETHVVAYGGEGNGEACRLLWTLDVIGHRNFSLLDGGMQAWLDEGCATEDGLGQARPGAYEVGRHTDAVADKDYVLAHIDDPDVVLLDTRSPAEFSGTDRRAQRGGHIPGAVNMDWILAMEETGAPRLKPEDGLRELLGELGVTPDKEVIAYCQTHRRSAHTYIALKALGYPRIKGYPGSWSEWGNDLALPVET